MPYQNINQTVAPTDVQQIKQAVATIRTKLPFLITLTSEERKRLFKIGDSSLSFVQNSLSTTRNNTGILPSSFNTVGFAADVELFAVLTEINTVLAQLASQVDDTRMAVGSEAMNGAAQVYQYVKTAAKNTPGLKPVADQLGERFQRTRPTAKAEKAAVPA